MAQLTIPLIFDSEDSTYNGTEDAYLQNVYLNLNKNKKYEIIKRPGLNSISATAMSSAPRGVWGEHFYIAGNTTVYYNTPDFDTAFTGATWDAGSSVIDFAKVATNDIVVVNWATGTYGDGYTLNTTTHAMTAIADADFPPNNNIALTRGVTGLDGYMFVLTRNGDIYHSDQDDATAWNALSFIGMDNPGTDAKFITRHRKHIVAFSDTSTEFFWNAGNPTGSTLSARRQLQQDIGVYDRESIWSNDNIVAWVSQSKEHELGVYLLDNLQIHKISTPEIDEYLIDGVDTISTVGELQVSGFNWKGRSFITVTFGTSTNFTMVYDTLTGRWYRWTFNDGEFSVAGAMKTTVGNLLYLFFRGSTQAAYFDHATYQDDTGSGAGTDNIDVQIQTPKIRGGQGEQNLTKTMSSLHILGKRGSSPNNVQVEYTDDDYQTYTDMGNLDISDVQNSLYQLGEFIERAFRLTHTANLPLKLEGLELTGQLGKD